MTTFTISLNDKTIYRSTMYNKKEIEQEICRIAKASKSGDEIEYYRSDKKFAYKPLLTVRNKKGVFKTMIIKGMNCYFKPFNFFQ